MSRDIVTIGPHTLYRGDCREVLPTIGKVDAVVTDPPYGVNFEGKATKHTVDKPGGYIGNDDGGIGPEIIRELLPIVTRAAVFSGVVNLAAYPASRDIGCVYCPSGAGIGRWGFTCFHPVLFYGPRPSNTLRPTSMQSFETAESNGHPCPKPIGWMRWVISLASIEGETILDPFMGSGTTGVACIRTGRTFIGIEKERKYFDIAVDRMREAWGENGLFKETTKPEPAELFAGATV